LSAEINARLLHTTPQITLQRGRAQLSAEIVCNCGVLTEGFELQRGRAQLSAEMAAVDFGKLFAKIASTGPRSIERGDIVGKIQLTNSEDASTGPRSIERGDTRRERRFNPDLPCFNGAALN